MSAPQSETPAPLPRAVALRYERRPGGPEDDVPAIVARGRGRIAEEILALARRHGIPVRSDPDLVALLATCDPGTSIPTELFTAVAELLVWLYRSGREPVVGEGCGAAPPRGEPPAARAAGEGA